jgi:serralysin
MTTYTDLSTVTHVDLTGTPNIDALLAGIKWGESIGTGANVSFSFPWANGQSASWASDVAGHYSSSDEPIGANHYGLNAVQMQATRSAIQAWANVANIQIQEITETPTGSSVGDIRIAWSSSVTPGSLGVTYDLTPSAAAGGDVWLNSEGSAASSTDWSGGGNNYMVLLHELGHALGLKHPGNYDANGGGSHPPYLPSALDNQHETLMSYNTMTSNIFRMATFAAGKWQFTYLTVLPDTPMVLDIAAIQRLYGANTSYQNGNDLYTFNPSTPFFRTLWDAGGNDTISASGFTTNCVIDLRPGAYSSLRLSSAPLPAGYIGGTSPTYTGMNNLGIALGVTIENAVGGSGNDTLIGNDANNTLTGDFGTDSLDGGLGIDTAVFPFTRASCEVTQLPDGRYLVRGINSISSFLEGSDTLSNIERLKLNGSSLALDLNGNAGSTAKILGAVFGKAAVANKTFVGIGLKYLDNGMGYSDLIQLALNAALGAGFSNEAEISLLFQNLVGVAPTSTQLASWASVMNTGQYTQASLAMMAVENGLNTANINLVGLAQTGLDYLPQ